MISEIKQSARQYPGSYRLGASGRTKLNGAIVTFIAYTNPNNITTACYIHYRTGGRDFGFTCYDLDIYNETQIKEKISYDMVVNNK